MRGDRLWLGVVVLAGLLAAACAAFGLLVGFEDDWGSTGEQVAFIALTLGGAAILAAGLYFARRRDRFAAPLIILGAVVCGFMIWWTILAPFVAVAVILLTIFWMRRSPTGEAAS
jgi:LPXTG-motif cell wall-anchored protein